LAEWQPFARLVLEAAYEATFAVAARVSAQTGVNRLYLTRLGGGAFGNPAAWITDAIAGAVRRFSACDLEVILVSHGGANPANRAWLG
jgi:O-acetyl-ADP-ribose deacetylase (regulator of RNase III)